MSTMQPTGCFAIDPATMKCRHSIYKPAHETYAEYCDLCRADRDWRAAHFEIDSETQIETEMRQQ